MRKLLLVLLLFPSLALAGLSCEEIEINPIDNGISWELERCWVPEGWLVMNGGYQKGGITFYPDKEHKWKLFQETVK